MNRSRENWLIGISIFVLLVIRLLYAAHLGLAEDEAYYWVWSKQLDIGYFDHPPMIAWWIKLGTSMLAKSSLAVRAIPIILGTLSLLFAINCSSNRLLCCWLLASFPLFCLGGIIATPDSPLLAFWCLGIWAFSRQSWLLLGIAAGGAMLSKYTGVLLLPLLLLAQPQLLRKRGPWIAIAVAFLCYCPNLYWNITHDLISYRFQLAHVSGPPRRIDFLAGQLGLMGPIMLLTAGWWWRRWPADPFDRSLWLSSVVPFVLAVWAGGEANWAAVSYAGIAVALSRQTGRWLRACAWGIGLNTVLCVLVLLHARAPIIDLPKDPLHRLQGGETLASAMAAWEQPDIWTLRYQEAAWIEFYSDIPAHVWPGLARMSQYDLWPRKLPESGIFVRPFRHSETVAIHRLGVTTGESSQITAYADTTIADKFVITHAWQSYPFQRAAP